MRALFFWGWSQVFSDYVWDSGPPSQTSTRIFLWGSLLVLAALVPLAWGLARRSGWGWLAGILVGPVVAAVLRELEVRWSWWDRRVSYGGSAYHWQFEAAVFVAPFVLAALRVLGDRGAQPSDPRNRGRPPERVLEHPLRRTTSMM